MKELSIEEKAKRYDEALKKLQTMRDAWNNLEIDYSPKDVVRDIEYYFPELKESDDERIRKWIIGVLSTYEHDKDLRNAAISWLEKQGEHYNFRNKIQVGDEVTRNRDGVLINLSQLKRVAKKDEKQGEQKETLCDKCKKEQPSHSCQDITELGRCAVEHEQKPADKVEPKFKVGDWIVQNGYGIFKVVEVKDTVYTASDYDKNLYYVPFYEENNCKLWSIQDAKEGDVLFMDNGLANCIFIYKSFNNGIINKYASYNKFGFEDEHYLVLNDGYIIPATKEQRDLLFQKIKEAGYEWDAKKKELKKIEQKQEWSEEDEKFAHGLIRGLKAKRDIHGHTTFSSDCIDITGTINWLKSLKDRVQPQAAWKPSDKQMKALEHFVRSVGESGYASPYDNNTKLLYSLLFDLKKLKRE